MSTSLKGVGFGVWIAIIIVVTILAAYSGYYGGYYHGLSAGLQQNAPTLPSSIKIGVIVSNVAYANDLLEGVWLAAKLVNDGGGVASRNLTLLTKYTGGDVETAKSMVTSMVDEGIKVFIGVLSDHEVKAIMPILRENNALLVLVSKETYDNVYDDPMIIKILGGPHVEAQAMVDLALKVGTRAAIIAINDSYSTKLASAINKLYSSLGGKIVYEVLYNETVDVTPDLERIKNLEEPPTVTFLIGYVDEVCAILANASKVQLNTTWILSSSLATEKLLNQEIAPYLEGSYAVIRCSPTEYPQMQDFIDLYVKTYKREPNEIAAYGFDSLRLIALSIAWTGQYDGPAIRKVVNEIANSFSGVTGRKVMDFNGNVIQDYEILKVVRIDDTYRFITVGYWIPVNASKAIIKWTAKPSMITAQQSLFALPI